MKTKTWLPLFNGFYGTIWESKIDDEVEYLTERVKEQSTESEYEAITDMLYIADEVSHAIDELKKDICISLTDIVKNCLVKDGYVKDIKMENLVSPKEYNFYNDSINVEITLTENNIKNIKKFIADHKEQYEKMVKDNYTSYDGFWSMHDNVVTANNEWAVKNAVQLEHNLGKVLEFILLTSVNEYDLYAAIEVYLNVDIDKLKAEIRNR
jgi:hypothetical protein